MADAHDDLSDDGARAGWGIYYAVVQRIPPGKVSTYGAVAEFAGRPRCARQVGYALAALRGEQHAVPWHRVVGSRSRNKAMITIRDATGGGLQRLRLEAEGIEFDGSGAISLERFGWRGPRRRKGAPGVVPRRA